MRFPQMIGDECPSPGTGTFHFTPSVGDHLSRYLPALTMPCPDGPRQRVQYFAPSPSTSIMVAATSSNTGPSEPAKREVPSTVAPRPRTAADAKARILMQSVLPHAGPGVNHGVI